MSPTQKRPVYITRSIALAGSTADTAAVAPAVAIAVAANVTVAALLPGALLGAAAATLGGSPTRVRNVYVNAHPDADTTSSAEVGVGADVSIGGALALKIALDTTLAASASTVTADTFQVVGESFDYSNANDRRRARATDSDGSPQATRSSAG